MLPLAALLLAGAAIQAQQVAPVYEAVSVKVNATGDQNSRYSGRAGGLVVSNLTLRGLIRNVWNLNNLQILGGPSWIDRDRFDVVATATGRPTIEERQAMAKAMLADRFKLVLHTEMRPLPIYALVMARPDGRLGPNMRPTVFNCGQAAPPGAAPAPTPAVVKTPPAPLGGHEVPECGTSTDNGILRSGGVGLDAFARTMAGPAGRIIVDKTGLTGRFDMVMLYSQGGNNAAPDLPSIFAAAQEQLGLKFEARTAPVEVLVIDSADKPTEN
jgi:uncharacterized protein (TIGR03435 family)